MYWKPVWHVLEGEFELVLANAAHIKNVPGRKTDVNDATWISDLLAHGLIRGSFVPPTHIQEMRDLTRTRKQLVRERAAHVMRIQKTLEDANFKLASVLTDVLGKTGRLIIESLIAGQADPEALAQLAQRVARKKHPEWDDATWHAYRHDLRIERSKPLLETIHIWLETERARVLPKSPIGEAIGYALNHWNALTRPWEAGFLEIDNGASERAIRPVALGRKNWLFAGSDEGGQTAATLMSLCATCKELGIDPFVYLRDVLIRVSTHPNSRIEELLPDRWKPAELADPTDRNGSITATPVRVWETR